MGFWGLAYFLAMMGSRYSVICVNKDNVHESTAASARPHRDRASACSRQLPSFCQKHGTGALATHHMMPLLVQSQVHLRSTGYGRKCIAGHTNEQVDLVLTKAAVYTLSTSRLVGSAADMTAPAYAGAAAWLLLLLLLL